MTGITLSICVLKEWEILVPLQGSNPDRRLLASIFGYKMVQGYLNNIGPRMEMEIRTTKRWPDTWDHTICRDSRLISCQKFQNIQICCEILRIYHVCNHRSILFIRLCPKIQARKLKNAAGRKSFAWKPRSIPIENC